jgi:hypothetical protein
MTAAGEDWRWSWRKGGATEGGNYYPFGLNDDGGPPIEEEPWASVRSAIYLLAREIYSMDVTSSRDGILLTGSVTSEQVKAAIASLLGRHAEPVRNELEVAAPFQPAGGGAPSALVVETNTVTRILRSSPGGQVACTPAFSGASGV